MGEGAWGRVEGQNLLGLLLLLEMNCSRIKAHVLKAQKLRISRQTL